MRRTPTWDRGSERVSEGCGVLGWAGRGRAAVPEVSPGGPEASGFQREGSTAALAPTPEPHSHSELLLEDELPPNKQKQNILPHCPPALPQTLGQFST